MHDSKPKSAGHPFNRPDADIILRSSDTIPVDFRVFKLLLSLASPFFSAAFTLPQPAEECKNDIPIITMEEDKRTLDLVLRLCYPISVEEPARLSSLGDLQLVLKAAIKFEMEGIQKYVRKVVVEARFIESQPLRVYAIACRYGWTAEARRAARFTLRQPITVAHHVEELEYISAAVYCRLQEYRRICGEAAASRAMQFTKALAVDRDDEWVWATCLSCSRSGSRGSPTRPGLRKWWVDWMNQVADELRKLPWGGMVKKFDLMKSAIIQANQCLYCRTEAGRQLEEFAHILATDIERIVSSVRLIDHGSKG